MIENDRNIPLNFETQALQDHIHCLITNSSAPRSKLTSYSAIAEMNLPHDEKARFLQVYFTYLPESIQVKFTEQDRMFEQNLHDADFPAIAACACRVLQLPLIEEQEEFEAEERLEEQLAREQARALEERQLIQDNYLHTLGELENEKERKTTLEDEYRQIQALIRDVLGQPEMVLQRQIEEMQEQITGQDASIAQLNRDLAELQAGNEEALAVLRTEIGRLRGRLQALIDEREMDEREGRGATIRELRQSVTVKMNRGATLNEVIDALEELEKMKKYDLLALCDKPILTSLIGGQALGICAQLSKETVTTASKYGVRFNLGVINSTNIPNARLMTYCGGVAGGTLTLLGGLLAVYLYRKIV